MRGSAVLETCAECLPARLRQFNFKCVCVMNVEQASISSWVTGVHGTRENTCPALDAMQEKRNFTFWCWLNRSRRAPENEVPSTFLLLFSY